MTTTMNCGQSHCSSANTAPHPSFFSGSMRHVKSYISGVISRVQQRQTHYYLNTLDDHLLNDIGLTRTDLKNILRRR